MTNEWKSDLAICLPLIILVGGSALLGIVSSYMESKVQIERLRLAQVQYQTEFIKRETVEELRNDK